MATETKPPATAQPATANEPLRGPELLRAAVNHIIENPDTFDQSRWHCGTKHCIAGHCQILAGKNPIESNAMKDAQEAIGLSDRDAMWLFAAHRTLWDIWNFTSIFINNFNRDRFDRGGFKRDGFDRDGFDRDGFNRDGFDRDGKKLPLLAGIHSEVPNE